jgi:hypothetical protein
MENNSWSSRGDIDVQILIISICERSAYVISYISWLFGYARFHAWDRSSSKMWWTATDRGALSSTVISVCGGVQREAFLGLLKLTILGLWMGNMWIDVNASQYLQALLRVGREIKLTIWGTFHAGDIEMVWITRDSVTLHLLTTVCFFARRIAK